MPKKCAFLVLFLAICAVPSEAESQRVPVVGDRVRVHAYNPTRESIGTVRSISPEGIEIADANRRLHLFLAQNIGRLEVSQGEYLREGRKVIAMLWLVGFTGAGAGFGAAVWSPCEEDPRRLLAVCALGPDSRGTSAAIGGGVGLVIGLAVANSSWKDQVAESWEDSVLPVGNERATIGLFRGATAGDIGIGFSIPFRGR